MLDKQQPQIIQLNINQFYKKFHSKEARQTANPSTITKFLSIRPDYSCSAGNFNMWFDSQNQINWGRISANTKSINILFNKLLIHPNRISYEIFCRVIAAQPSKHLFFTIVVIDCCQGDEELLLLLQGSDNL